MSELYEILKARAARSRIPWDPDDHPRDRLGRFTDAAGGAGFFDTMAGAPVSAAPHSRALPPKASNIADNNRVGVKLTREFHQKKLITSGEFVQHWAPAEGQNFKRGGGPQLVDVWAGRLNSPGDGKVRYAGQIRLWPKRRANAAVEWQFGDARGPGPKPPTPLESGLRFRRGQRVHNRAWGADVKIVEDTGGDRVKVRRVDSSEPITLPARRQDLEGDAIPETPVSAPRYAGAAPASPSRPPKLQNVKAGDRVQVANGGRMLDVMEVEPQIDGQTFPGLRVHDDIGPMTMSWAELKHYEIRRPSGGAVLPEPTPSGDDRWVHHGNRIDDIKNLGGGINGTYTGSLNGRKVVVKPFSQAASRVIRDRIPPRGDLPREEAAYLIGKRLGVGVPPTAARRGMKYRADGFDVEDDVVVMEFIENKGIYAENPVAIKDEDAIRLAAFDYVIGNLDRHGGNLLVSRDGKGVIPIDHGLAFPDGNPGGYGNAIALESMRGREIPLKMRGLLQGLLNDRIALRNQLMELGLSRDAVQATIDRIEELVDEGRIPTVGLLGDVDPWARGGIQVAR